MRSIEESRRARAWARLAVLGLVSAAAAGCSADATRFNDNPFRSPYASNAPAQSDVTGSVPTRRVQSTALPPPGGSYQSSALPPAQGGAYRGGTAVGGAGMASYEPGPAYEPGRRHEATGSLPRTAAAQPRREPHYSWNGGVAITVRPGETLPQIARRHGVPESAILAANGLKSPVLRPGQNLVIPRYMSGEATGSAPRRTAASTPENHPAGGVHVVAPGETLMSISRLYGKSRTEIAQANGLSIEARLRQGQRLTIPGAARAQANKVAAVTPKPAPRPESKAESRLAAAQVPAPAARHEAPVVKAEPAVQKASAPAATAQLASATADLPAASVPSTTATANATPNFRWPVLGRVISSYGSRINGEKNDGINLAVPQGTTVKAADDGVVAYAGNELKGYGNLVLVRHPSGYVTAYAHASDILVKRGDHVRRGQAIARAGQTGNVTSPQLHFEIRKNSAPVDPMQFLSGT